MKVVYGSLYVVATALDELPSSARAAVEMASGRLPATRRYNVIAISSTHGVVKFLWYPDLDRCAHPTLAESTRVSLSPEIAVRHTKYVGDNPLILHRLESLLPNRDPRKAALVALTAQEETAGLYRSCHARRISRRSYWNALCEMAGLVDSLAPSDANFHRIRRERTAIGRAGPSAPTRWALSRNHIRPMVVDWGAGRGRDGLWLRERGFSTMEYDPYYLPETQPANIDLREARTVLLNYVLNVIEVADERRRLLQYLATHTCSGTRFVVCTRAKAEVDARAAAGGWQRFYDGYVTKRATFQRGFDAEELADMCHCLGRVIDAATLPGGVVCVAAA